MAMNQATPKAVASDDSSSLHHAIMSDPRLAGAQFSQEEVSFINDVVKKVFTHSGLVEAQATGAAGQKEAAMDDAAITASVTAALQSVLALPPHANGGSKQQQQRQEQGAYTGVLPDGVVIATAFPRNGSPPKVDGKQGNKEQAANATHHDDLDALLRAEQLSLDALQRSSSIPTAAGQQAASPSVTTPTAPAHEVKNLEVLQPSPAALKVSAAFEKVMGTQLASPPSAKATSLERSPISSSSGSASRNGGQQPPRAEQQEAAVDAVIARARSGDSSAATLDELAAAEQELERELQELATRSAGSSFRDRPQQMSVAPPELVTEPSPLLLSPGNLASGRAGTGTPLPLEYAMRHGYELDPSGRLNRAESPRGNTARKHEALLNPRQIETLLLQPDQQQPNSGLLSSQRPAAIGPTSSNGAKSRARTPLGTPGARSERLAVAEQWPTPNGSVVGPLMAPSRAAAWSSPAVSAPGSGRQSPHRPGSPNSTYAERHQSRSPVHTQQNKRGSMATQAGTMGDNDDEHRERYELTRDADTLVDDARLVRLYERNTRWKEGNEERYNQARKEAEAAEMDGCTFAPVLNRHSQAILKVGVRYPQKPVSPQAPGSPKAFPPWGPISPRAATRLPQQQIKLATFVPADGEEEQRHEGNVGRKAVYASITVTPGTPEVAHQGTAAEAAAGKQDAGSRLYNLASQLRKRRDERIKLTELAEREMRMWVAPKSPHSNVSPRVYDVRRPSNRSPPRRDTSPSAAPAATAPPPAATAAPAEYPFRPQLNPRRSPRPEQRSPGRRDAGGAAAAAAAAVSRDAHVMEQQWREFETILTRCDDGEPAARLKERPAAADSPAASGPDVAGQLQPAEARRVLIQEMTPTEAPHQVEQQQQQQQQQLEGPAGAPAEGDAVEQRRAMLEGDSGKGINMQSHPIRTSLAASSLLSPESSGAVSAMSTPRPQRESFRAARVLSAALEEEEEHQQQLEQEQQRQQQIFDREAELSRQAQQQQQQQQQHHRYQQYRQRQQQQHSTSAVSGLEREGDVQLHHHHHHHHEQQQAAINNGAGIVASSRYAISEHLDWDEFVERQQRFLEDRSRKLEQMKVDAAAAPRAQLSPGSRRILRRKEQAAQPPGPESPETASTRFLKRVEEHFTGAGGLTVAAAAAAGGKAGNKKKPSPPEFTFRPKITTKGRNMQPRDFHEMSEGDRLRKEAWVEQQRILSEVALLEGATFAPRIYSKHAYPDVKSRLNLGHPEAYLAELERRKMRAQESREQALKEREEAEMQECTFHPHITPVPRYLHELSDVGYTQRFLEARMAAEAAMPHY